MYTYGVTANRLVASGQNHVSVTPQKCTHGVDDATGRGRLRTPFLGRGAAHAHEQLVQLPPQQLEKQRALWRDSDSHASRQVHLPRRVTSVRRERVAHSPEYSANSSSRGAAGGGGGGREGSGHPAGLLDALNVELGGGGAEEEEGVRRDARRLAEKEARRVHL